MKNLERLDYYSFLFVVLGWIFSIFTLYYTAKDRLYGALGSSNFEIVIDFFFIVTPAVLVLLIFLTISRFLQTVVIIAEDIDEIKKTIKEN